MSDSLAPDITAMKMIERRQYEGAWWGRSLDGTWFRWSNASVGWEGPFTPPWPPEPTPLTPQEEAIVAAALATTAPSVSPQMNRVDAWWNRHFPPFSTRRLVFGLVALPVISSLPELLWVAAGREASLPRYLFVCVAGGALLASAWLPGMQEMAQRLRANGAFDTASPWPWRRKRALPPPPPLPPLRETFRGDFLVALPFAAAIVIVMSATTIGLADTFVLSNLLLFGATSLATAAVVALRTSVWGLVIFSVCGGLVGGLALVLLSLMTWSDPGVAGFLVGWAFGSVLLFLHAYPIWLRMRDLEARGFRLPMWLMMGGSVLLVSGGALVFLAER
jgi:hypothetical protein